MSIAESMQPAGCCWGASSAEPDREDRLRRFLNVYWLRPENAFWTVLRSLAWARVRMASPSIDLSCGDGVFSFISYPCKGYSIKHLDL